MSAHPNSPASAILIIEEDGGGETEFRETFARLRASHHELARAPQDDGRVMIAARMHDLASPLANTVRVDGLPAAARCGEALCLLLRDIIERPRKLGPETLRTLAQAVDFLAALCQTGKAANTCNPMPGCVLVVDDEPISRRALCSGLEKVGLKSTAVDQPEIALSLLKENGFDLITLDITMPGMTGHELCFKLRSLPLHKFTPVIFVTGLDNLENRAVSLASGACDVIAKPFRHAEFGLRALLHIMRSRQPAKTP